MKKFRLYYNKDEELKWIQRLCNEGWALEKFFAGVYTFVPCEPGQYIYDIDLLGDGPDEFETYREFMEDAGVEVVQRWYRWVFLRKKAEDGPFDMYTDPRSKVEAYGKIKKFFRGAMLLELLILVFEATLLIASPTKTQWGIFLFCVVVIAAFTMAMLKNIWYCDFKIKQLLEEAGNYEEN